MILAPAMNTVMWTHKLTQQQLTTIRGFFQHGSAANSFRVVDPQAKLLACGEYGDGALAEVSDIVASVFDCAKSS
jgi:phosphopantothenoylcysteine synthetase/decarboxylase